MSGEPEIPSPAEALARLDANREAYLKEPAGSPRLAALLDEREQLARNAYLPAAAPTPLEAANTRLRQRDMAPCDRDARRAVLREEMLGLEEGSPGWTTRFEEYERLLLAGESQDPAAATPPEAPAPVAEAEPIDVEVTADDEREVAAVVDAFVLPDGLTWNAEMLAAGHAIAREALGPQGGLVWAEGVATIRDAARSGPPPSAEQCHATLLARGAYETTLANARAVVHRLPDAMLDFLDDSGLGNHPDVVAYFARVAERLA